MAEDSGQERTERATPRRLEQAREQGQVARSRELGTALVVLAGCGALWLLGARLAADLGQLTAAGLRLDAALATDPQAMTARLADLGGDALWALAPWLGVVLVAALAGPALMGGLRMAPAALAFKGSRLDPLAGLKRLLGTHGPFEALKGLLKFAAIGALAALVLWWQGPALLGLGTLAPPEALRASGDLLVRGALWMALPLAVIAGLDVPFALWRHGRELRMTRQQVREEMRDSEGRPEVRARQRERAGQMARSRLDKVVPVADVVLVNPTHYAVALRYESGKGGAPRVTAKGADALAGRIRALARTHGVPILEQPPLTRALYHGTRVGREIPAELYAAVAQVLAWVYRLRVAPGAPEPALIDVPVTARKGAMR